MIVPILMIGALMVLCEPSYPYRITHYDGEWIVTQGASILYVTTTQGAAEEFVRQRVAARGR
jgi:hypothetical protein